ncbi:MAG: hypothetical protein KA886_05505, partial [Candidatus Cloacimonetes bacterium]|nr:hypothetical protein [Candidatus Cloacimonadota bacterium]
MNYQIIKIVLNSKADFEPYARSKKMYRKLPACENYTRTASILLADNGYKQDACSTEDCHLAESSYKQDACSTEDC